MRDRDRNAAELTEKVAYQGERKSVCTIDGNRSVYRIQWETIALKLVKLEKQEDLTEYSFGSSLHLQKFAFSLPRRTSKLSVSSLCSSSTSRRTSYPRWNNRSASPLPDSTPRVTFSIPGRDLRLSGRGCADLPSSRSGKRSNVAAEFISSRDERFSPHGVKSSSAAAAVQHRAARGKEGGRGATPASERGRAFPPLLAPPNPNR